MKRSITRWTTTVAAVAMLGLPVVGFANTLQDPAPQQQPQPTQPQPAQPQPQPAQPQQEPPQQPQPQPAQPQPTDPQPAQPQQQPQPTQPQQPASPTATPQADQTVSPQEHLSQAKAAVDSIAATSVPAKSRAQLAQLKKHLAALDKAGSTSTGATATAPKASAKSNVNWGTEVAAIDKIITEMVGTETTGATTPGATGTSGSSKAASAVALDDATRSKLMEVRAHITAYAAGMAGSSTPKTEAAASNPAASAAQSEPSSPATPPAAASAATPEPAAGAATPSAAPQSAAPAGEPQQPAAPEQAQPPAGAQEPAAQPQAAQPQMDTEAARRHLMAARESLSQLTQLPAATQLSGEARTQVAQLISNFNELITTQSNWRAAYAKVDGNLTALIGPDNSDAEAKGGAPTTATGATATPGAVGTAGAASVELDPAIRAKLVEFRHNLAEFQKASGGAEK